MLTYSGMIRLSLRASVSQSASESSLRIQHSLRHISLRSLSTKEKSKVLNAIQSAPVVLFMKGTPSSPACKYSRNTIQILGYQGVDPIKFNSYNVLDDQELRDGVKEYSDWPTIPQLYLNGQFIGGHDLVVNLGENGDLAELLDQAGVLIPEETQEETQNNTG